MKLIIVASIGIICLAIAYGITYGVVYLLHLAFHFAMLTPLQVSAIYIALVFVGGFFRSSEKSA